MKVWIIVLIIIAVTCFAGIIGYILFKRKRNQNEMPSKIEGGIEGRKIREQLGLMNSNCELMTDEHGNELIEDIVEGGAPCGWFDRDKARLSFNEWVIFPKEDEIFKLLKNDIRDIPFYCYYTKDDHKNQKLSSCNYAVALLVLYAVRCDNTVVFKFGVETNAIDINDKNNENMFFHEPIGRLLNNFNNSHMLLMDSILVFSFKPIANANVGTAGWTLWFMERLGHNILAYIIQAVTHCENVCPVTPKKMSNLFNPTKNFTIPNGGNDSEFMFPTNATGIVYNVTNEQVAEIFVKFKDNWMHAVDSSGCLNMNEIDLYKNEIVFTIQTDAGNFTYNFTDKKEVNAFNKFMPIRLNDLAVNEHVHLNLNSLEWSYCGEFFVYNIANKIKCDYNIENLILNGVNTENYTIQNLPIWKTFDMIIQVKNKLSKIPSSTGIYNNNYVNDDINVVNNNVNVVNNNNVTELQKCFDTSLYYFNPLDYNYNFEVCSKDLNLVIPVGSKLIINKIVRTDICNIKDDEIDFIYESTSDDLDEVNSGIIRLPFQGFIDFKISNESTIPIIHRNETVNLEFNCHDNIKIHSIHHNYIIYGYITNEYEEYEEEEEEEEIEEDEEQ